MQFTALIMYLLYETMVISLQVDIHVKFNLHHILFFFSLGKYKRSTKYFLPGQEVLKMTGYFVICSKSSCWKEWIHFPNFLSSKIKNIDYFHSSAVYRSCGVMQRFTVIRKLSTQSSCFYEVILQRPCDLREINISQGERRTHFFQRAVCHVKSSTSSWWLPKSWNAPLEVFVAADYEVVFQDGFFWRHVGCKCSAHPSEIYGPHKVYWWLEQMGWSLQALALPVATRFEVLRHPNPAGIQQISFFQVLSK